MQMQMQMHTPLQRTRTGTGTDNLPILNPVSHPGTQGGMHTSMQAGMHGQADPAPVHHSCEGLNAPCVWRSGRAQAAAKVDALSTNGMEEIEILAFLMKEAG